MKFDFVVCSLYWPMTYARCTLTYTLT